MDVAYLGHLNTPVFIAALVSRRYAAHQCLPPCPTSWCWRHHPLSGHGVGATLVCRGLRGQVARMVLAPIEAIESQGGIFLWSLKSHI